MTSSVSTESRTAPAALQPEVRSVPRAVWIAIGSLSLVSAGLAGALVTRAFDGPSAAPQSALHASVDATQQRTQVAPLMAQLNPATGANPAVQAPAQATANTSAQPTAQAQVQQPKPKPKPVPVRPATPSASVASTDHARWNEPLQTTRAAVCASCGSVESVQAVQEQGAGTGLGAVAGGVVGGLLGNQVGGGNGKKAMTVLGAVGGGFAGHEAEKRVRATTAYDVQVRMEDGSVRSFRREQPISVGTRVLVDGDSLRVSNGSNGSNGIPARTIRTSGPA